jgi:hypothetical protein
VLAVYERRDPEETLGSAVGKAEDCLLYYKYIDRRTGTKDGTLKEKDYDKLGAIILRGCIDVLGLTGPSACHRTLRA